MTQESVAEVVHLEQPYYATIENNGQHPSLQVLYDIVQLLHVSLDEFFMPWKKDKKSSKRNLVDSLLDQLSDQDLLIIEGTIKGIINSKEQK
jgi:transcriptional regulator with XRE-family HTH domain